jgi:cytoskeleton protein RodZ
MSDARADLSPAPAGPGSPGVWLREAREQAGLSIDAVAATLKLSPRTLMALEADDHASLRDAVFVRALAQGVCRVLQRDPAPVLAMLPRAVMRAPQPLADQDEIRSEDGRFQRRAAWPALVLTPLTAVLALLVLGAVAVAWAPDEWLPWGSPLAPAAGAAAPAVVAEPPVVLPVGQPAPSDTVSNPGPATAGPAAPTPASR